MERRHYPGVADSSGKAAQSKVTLEADSLDNDWHARLLAVGWIWWRREGRTRVKVEDLLPQIPLLGSPGMAFIMQLRVALVGGPLRTVPSFPPY